MSNTPIRILLAGKFRIFRKNPGKNNSNEREGSIKEKNGIFAIMHGMYAVTWSLLPLMNR
jgi:hypothetical protein